MKIAAIILVSLVILFIGVRVFGFVAEERQLGHDLADIETRLTAAQTDEADLKSEAQYLANPINLEKELRARFNFKKPGEKMIIIVPPQTSTAPTGN